MKIQPFVLWLLFVLIGACAPVDENTSSVAQATTAPPSAQCLLGLWHNADCDFIVVVPTTRPFTAQGTYRAEPRDWSGTTVILPTPAPYESGYAYTGSGIYTTTVTTTRLEMNELWYAWRAACVNPAGGYYTNCETWHMYQWADSQRYVRLVVQLSGDANSMTTMPHVESYFYPNYITSMTNAQWAVSYAVQWQASTQVAQRTVTDPYQYPSHSVSHTNFMTNFVLPAPGGLLVSDFYYGWTRFPSP